VTAAPRLGCLTAALALAACARPAALDRLARDLDARPAGRDPWRAALPAPFWEPQPAAAAAARGASLRGVRAVSAAVAWASGSAGTVLRTTNGGRTWARLPVPSADSLDFRSVWAFDSLAAVVASAGEAAEGRARIYRTADGGRTWALVHRDTARGVFYDAVAFWDREHGLVLSDPVGEGAARRFVVLATADGGRTWARTPAEGQAVALAGEAAFAAGNAALAVAGSSRAWFVTGGPLGARAHATATGGARWDAVALPVAPRSASAGLFAVACASPTVCLAAGGDYRAPRAGAGQFARTEDGGRRWERTDLGNSAPGYWSGLAFVPGAGAATFVAVGGAGTAVTRDAGRAWTVTDTTTLNAVSFAAPDDGAGGAPVGWGVGPRGRVVRVRAAP
jgi:photosystem II stability/assembly factor-like uncharacterized protein